MWFPVELHSEQAQRGGLADAVLTTLQESDHYHIVDQRRIANQLCDTTPSESARITDALNHCSSAYVGTRHMRPMAPFCGFTVSSELGIAYLEHLIAFEPLNESRFGPGWLAAGLHGFVHALLHDRENLTAVVLPLPIEGDPPSGFEQVKVDNRYRVERMKHHSRRDE